MPGRTLGTFGLVLLFIVALILVALSFTLGLAHPLPWILLSILLVIPLIHNLYISSRFIRWKNKYSVGIPSIDDDHKKLIISAKPIWPIRNFSMIRMLCKLLLILFFFTLTSVPVLAQEYQVVIKKFKFIPAEITIKAGDSIIWLNEEKRQYHSVWFEQSGEPETDYFFPGETYSRIFNEAGNLPYHCGPHPEMTGIVHVK